MTQIERSDPPHVGSEAETLVTFLDYHRDTVRNKAEGLDAAQLDQRLEPSSMTLGGLLKHLAYVEDWWFNQVFAGNPEPEPWASVDWKADGDWDWHSASKESPEELRALLDDAIATSDRVLADALASPAGLDATSRLEQGRLARGEFSLRWVLAHMLEEYARHNGHADLLRESIDGRVGE
ncbi:MAG: DinB family protein [Marmoricola sp.]